MTGGPPDNPMFPPTRPGRPLLAYLLGTVGTDAVEALQRRLVYEVSGGGCPAVILCDHPSGVTFGRDGSRLDVRLTPAQLTARDWPVRWVARGGGTLLHAAGQVACYPVLPLADLGLTPAGYVESLCRIGADLCAGFGVPAEPDFARPGVRVRGRRAAHVGVAVRSGVSAFGLVVNATPDLEPFRDVHCDGDPAAMTSLQRECPTRVRPQAVRQRLLDLLQRRFNFDRLSVVHETPTFPAKPTRHAITHRSR